MKAIVTKSTLFMAVVFPLLLAGCGASDPVAPPAASPAVQPSGGGSPSTSPHLGEFCKVYFRYDVLGASGHPYGAITDAIDGAEVSVAGTLKKLDSEWVVVEVPGELFNTERWIPCDRILAIDFHGPPKNRKTPNPPSE